jgi:small subunit ribosomal protein S16
MLKIRLQRTGRANDPYFRLIVTPHTHKAKTGKPTEVIGNIDVQQGKREINKERASYWLAEGAQPSETVYNMFIDEGILKGDKQKTLSPKKAKSKKK